MPSSGVPVGVPLPPYFFTEEEQMSGQEQDHMVNVKVGIFFVFVIVGFFVIGMIQ